MNKLAKMCLSWRSLGLVVLLIGSFVDVLAYWFSGEYIITLALVPLLVYGSFVMEVRTGEEVLPAVIMSTAALILFALSTAVLVLLPSDRLLGWLFHPGILFLILVRAAPVVFMWCRPCHASRQ